MLKRIVSGGQSGSDQAGLRAAKKVGLETGGWMPKGCITTSGTNFSLLNEFGMQEHDKFGYPPRTDANVKSSDGTIRLAANFKSAGEVCTLKAINWYNKPYLDVNVKNPLPIEDVVSWIKNNNIEVLNIAGNAEPTYMGIGDIVEKYLEQVFNQCRQAS